MVAWPARVYVSLLFVLAIWHQPSSGHGHDASIQFLARRTIPQEDIRPYNGPGPDYNESISYAGDKWEMLHQYTSIMNARIREPHSPTDRRDILDKTQKKLSEFIDLHIKDLKRLQFELDKTILTMTIYKMKKKMETAEKKINSSMAMIPFGVYASPEFKCLGTSYYLVSAHNQEDVEMILSSERKPHCYAFRGAFAWGGFYHRHSESMYIGPHGDQFNTNTDMSQGLYCPEPQPSSQNHGEEVTLYDDYQCAFKISPREEFPESVQYEPKISYWCGPYRYFIPPTTSIRCIFSIFSMNFIMRFGYDGVTYKSQDLSFMYQNGQVFYSDEPWAGMSCWNWACKWRHNQNQRGNDMFSPRR